MSGFADSWRYWGFLLGAIVLEVAGTTLMKWSQGLAGVWPTAGHGGMIVCIAGSYYLLALATVRLPIGVAFACWEGLGLAFISLAGAAMGEPLTVKRIVALVAVFVGILLIHHGTDDGKNKEEAAS